MQKGLFGMNINLLAGNPPWWYYFVVLGPVCVAIALGYLILRRQTLQYDDYARAPSVMDTRKRLIAAAHVGHVDEIVRTLATVNFIEKGEYARVAFHHIHPGARDQLREKVDFDSGDPVGKSKTVQWFLRKWSFGIN